MRRTNAPGAIGFVIFSRARASPPTTPSYHQLLSRGERRRTLSNFPASCQASLMRMGAQFLLLTTALMSFFAAAIDAGFVLRGGPVQSTAAAADAAEEEKQAAISRSIG